MKIRSRTLCLFLLFLLLLSVPAFAASPEEARAKLEGRKIPYTAEVFVYMAATGDTAAVQLFLAAGMDPNVRNKKGLTSLIAAAGGGKLEVVKLLLEKGADLEAQSPESVRSKGRKRRRKKIYFGGTPLMHAARSGHADTVQLLLKKGADLKAMDAKQGLTALHWAVFSNQPATVKALLDQGASPGVKNKRGLTSLVMAAYYARPEILGLLLDHTPPADQDAARKSLLLTAAAAGRTANVKFLLAKGADVNARSDNGQTPLMLAAKAGKKDTVKLLLEKGADAGARDQEGNRALEYAKADAELMKLLFQAESRKTSPGKK